MVGREFRGREEVKEKNPTGREDVHPQNGLNGLILNWCIGGCWFTPARGSKFSNGCTTLRRMEFPWTLMKIGGKLPGPRDGQR